MREEDEREEEEEETRSHVRKGEQGEGKDAGIGGRAD